MTRKKSMPFPSRIKSTKNFETLAAGLGRIGARLAQTAFYRGTCFPDGIILTCRSQEGILNDDALSTPYSSAKFRAPVASREAAPVPGVGEGANGLTTNSGKGHTQG